MVGLLTWDPTCTRECPSVIKLFTEFSSSLIRDLKENEEMYKYKLHLSGRLLSEERSPVFHGNLLDIGHNGKGPDAD